MNLSNVSQLFYFSYIADITTTLEMKQLLGTFAASV